MCTYADVYLGYFYVRTPCSFYDRACPSIFCLDEDGETLMPVKNLNKNDAMQIKKGDCLISSKPFSYVLSSKHKDNHCDYCFKR